MKYLLLLFGIISLLVAGGGCDCNSEKGLLQGDVTIGPISPVAMSGEKPDINCNVYEARRIIIYNEKGNSLIQQVDIICVSEENRAYYQIWLEPGIYIVDINYVGIDRSSDVPETVAIKSGTITQLNIDIDTGIR